MGVEAVKLPLWQAFGAGGASPQIEAEEAGAPASLVSPARERSCVWSTNLRALEDSVEQYAIAATRKSSRAKFATSTTSARIKTSNTYPSSHPGESKSSKPASVFKANTTNANFTNAVNAAHAPRTG